MPAVPPPSSVPNPGSSPTEHGSSPQKILLTIAGFDPSGGAGILADIKTFHAHGLYGMACITALTVQNTQGVRAVEPVPIERMRAELEALSVDVTFAAVKIGMLGTGAIAAGVAEFLGRVGDAPGGPVPIVLDPILRSSSGAEMLDAAGQRAMRGPLLARAGWVTPNLLELATLTGRSVARGRSEVEASAQALVKLAAEAGHPDLRVVVTGGHAAQPDDLLWTGSGGQWFAGERVKTRSTHGTGCTFSSALAARLALGDGDAEAVRNAKAYVTGALRSARPIGLGHGPLEHFWRWRQ